MRRKMWLGALGLAAVLVAGGLFASNMGFKLNYTLDGPGTNGSATGTSSLALPYNQQTNLTNAEDLINDVNASAGSSVVANVARWLKASDGLEVYTGTSGVNFSLTPGEGYLIKVGSTASYIVVGSHAPTLAITLDGPGSNGSATGTTLWSYPYHSTVGIAGDLITEIDTAAGSAVVANVARWLKSSDGLEVYTGTSGVNFALTPGEGYWIKVGSTVSWVPSHY